MASFMRRNVPLLKNKLIRTYAKERLVRDGGFYILLPEVPPDTAETNAILRHNSYPQFSQIGPDQIVTGCAKAAIQYEVDLSKHVTTVQESDTERTFENVIAPADDLHSQISYPFLIARNLNSAKGGHYITAFKRINRQVESAKAAKWASPAFYNLVKEVNSRGDLTDSQRRLVDTYLFEAKMAGLDLTDKDEKHLLWHIRRLSEHKHDFRIRVTSCERLFNHTISDFDVISEMPKSIAKLMVEEGDSVVNGPWKLSLEYPVYGALMVFCKDRGLRWLLYDAYINRSSRRFISEHLDNHMRIGDIREQRTIIASCHGYETFADMTIANKMAADVDNVLNMLEYYKNHFKPLAAEDLAGLQEFANSKGFHTTLEQWDIPFWMRKHTQHFYPYFNTETMWEYFPFNRVLSNLFDITSQMFGITIENHTKEVDLWDSSISFYKVFDAKSREELGSFYLDPFSRPSKPLHSWCEHTRERHGPSGQTPIMYVQMQLPMPLLPDQPVLMSEANLQRLMQVFANALRFILDTCPHSELNTYTNMEDDAVFILPQLFCKVFLSRPMLRRLSGHVDTGQPIPDQLLDSIIGGYRNFENYSLVKQLYDSAFDMELNFSDDYWLDIKKKVWEEFLPTPHSMDDESPCSLYSVFTEPTASLIYSYLWSDMIASDLFKVFSDASLDDLDKLTTVGLRFRENYLSYGNSLSGNETFRRFTGRDPALESLVEYYSHPS